ncbi:MAG: HEAT repeat domain-containing protein [bacterium]
MNTNCTKDINYYLGLLKSEDKFARREAAERLGELKSPLAVYPLTKALCDNSKGVQEAAADALINIGGEGTVYNMAPLLRNENLGVRNIAIEILSKIGRDNLELLISLLGDKDNHVRMFIADILGNLGDKLSVLPLIKSLYDEDQNVQQSVINSLGFLKDPIAVNSLMNIFSTTKEGWIKFSIAQALAKIGDKRAIEPLLNNLSSDDELVVYGIIEALGTLGDISVVPSLSEKLLSSQPPLSGLIIKTLVEISEKTNSNIFIKIDKDTFTKYLVLALEDGDQEVRDTAIRGLIKYPIQKAAKPLVKILKGIAEDDEEKRLLLAQAIEKTDDIKIITEMLNDEKKIASLACLIIGRAGIKEAIPHLSDLLESSDNIELRREAISAISSIKDSNSVDLFISYLDDRDGHVRRTAANALGLLKNKKALASLFNLLKREPYGDVIDQTLHSITTISGKKVIQDLINLLKDKKPLLRELATIESGNLKDNESIDKVIFALSEFLKNETVKGALSAVLKIVEKNEEENR